MKKVFCKQAHRPQIYVVGLSPERTAASNIAQRGSMTAGVPYSLPLDPDTARQLVVLGGTLLLLDVPPALVVGFDQQVYLRH